MSFDLKLFGNKLSRCRLNLEMSVSEVSNLTGVDATRLQEFENGVAEPSGDEILILADFFKQDYIFFISNQQKSASEQIDILYRKYGSSFSKEDRWIVQEFIYLCECESQVLRSLEIQKLQFNFSPTGTYFKGHGVDAAIAARKLLGFNDNQTIRDPYAEFRRLGIHIFRRRLVNSNISGLFVNHPWAGRCILVNYSEDIFRQNFTLAHEAAHAIFDAGENINISFEGDSSSTDLREIRANTFASNFLISKDFLKTLRVSQWTEAIIRDLAIQLSVNIQTLLIALKEAGKIDNAIYNEFKAIKISKALKEDPELVGLSDKIRKSKQLLLENGLSAFYVRKCHEAYQNKLISASKLAEMFLVNDTELPSVLELFKLKVDYGN